MKSKLMALGLLGAGCVAAFAGGAPPPPPLPQITVTAHIMDPKCCHEFCSIQLPCDRLIADVTNDGLGTATSVGAGGTAEVDPCDLCAWQMVASFAKCGLYGVVITIQGSGQQQATYPSYANATVFPTFATDTNAQNLETPSGQLNLIQVGNIQIVTGDCNRRGYCGRGKRWLSHFKPWGGGWTWGSSLHALVAFDAVTASIPCPKYPPSH